MSDWLDDLYESPGSDVVSLVDRKQEVIDSIIEEFEVNHKSKVRIRWIIEEKMKIEGYVYSSDILEIYYGLLETGDYDGELMKPKGISDVLIRRKPWHERNRILFVFITSVTGYVATIAIAFIIGLIFGKSCNQ